MLNRINQLFQDSPKNLLSIYFCAGCPTKVTRQLCGGFLFPQPVQGSYKINHIPICTTSEAVETLVQLHAGGLIVVERAASHPVSVYPDSVMLRSLSCRNGLLHSFKYIQINSSL